jgi:hypothetical protein
LGQDVWDSGLKHGFFAISGNPFLPPFAQAHAIFTGGKSGGKIKIIIIVSSKGLNLMKSHDFGMNVTYGMES